MLKKLKIIFIILIILGILYIIYDKYGKNIIPTPTPERKITVENISANIDKYYIYGNHFNFYAKITLPDEFYQDIKLVMINNTDTEIPIEVTSEKNNITFYTNKLFNEGIELDTINTGNNYLLLKVTSNNIEKYYPITSNETIDLDYYTLSKYNNKININKDNDYKTLALNVSKNTENIGYDVVIDPGHGGKDSGACSKTNCEKPITLDVSLKIKDLLESYGIKTYLTRDKDETLSIYNDNGRIDRACSSKAKYLISIHLNSHTIKNKNGVEVLTPYNIDYTFAKNLANNIVNDTGINYSNNLGFKKYNGIYTRKMTKEEIDNSTKNLTKKGLTQYKNKSTSSAYYFIIRETGGVIQGAYVDGTIPNDGYNKHYNSLSGLETYVIELGYIINDSDTELILNKKDIFASSIANTIKNELKY